MSDDTPELREHKLTQDQQAQLTRDNLIEQMVLYGIDRKQAEIQVDSLIDASYKLGAEEA